MVKIVSGGRKWTSSVTITDKPGQHREEEVWLLLHQAGVKQAEIARRVGLSRQRVHQRLSRAQWNAERSPGRLDALRKHLSLTLTGSSIEIQTRQCGHLSLAGIECLVCSKGEADARIGAFRPKPPDAPKPKLPGPKPSPGITPAQREKALTRATLKAAKAEAIRKKSARTSSNSTRRRKRSRG